MSSSVLTVCDSPGQAWAGRVPGTPNWRPYGVCGDVVVAGQVNSAPVATTATMANATAALGGMGRDESMAGTSCGQTGKKDKGWNCVCFIRVYEGPRASEM